MLALERKKSDYFTFRLQDGDFDVLPHGSNRFCKRRMKKWAGEIRIRLLQLDPNTNQILAKLPTGNKCAFHGFRAVNTERDPD